MARSMYSSSPSPTLTSSHLSDDSSSGIEDLGQFGESGDYSQLASRPSSPMQVENQGDDAEADTMSCQWEDCGKVFSHLPTLIKHIHDDHIGVHKSNYTCEWAACIRRGIAQTSRFALISHIRSHTGEKPFTCLKPECDKSFTRSDALAKHMRIQHNISPPLPGRGGNRKRKRDEPEPGVHGSEQTPYGYNTFKVEPHHPSDTHPADQDEGRASPSEANQNNNGSSAHLQNGTSLSRPLTPDSDPNVLDEDDQIPEHLLAVMDPTTGLIMGRTPAMVRYLLMKAKYRWILEQHESLLEELRVHRYEEKCWRERKDALLDELLRAHFGLQAEELALPPVMAFQNHYTGDREEEGYPP